MLRSLTGFALVLAMTGWLMEANVRAGETPDFSGTWVLNMEKSTLPQPPRGGADQGGERGDGPPRGGRRGGGGPMMGGGAAKIVVSQEDGEIHSTMETPRGNREQVYKPGAGPQETSGMMGGTAQVETNWEGSALMIKQVQNRETPNGTVTFTSHQTWKLSEDGKTLHQHQVLETPRGKRTFDLVYDRQ